jgi:hypothetical protein
VNVPDDNIDTIKKAARTFIGASNEVVLEVNAEKTKYIFACYSDYRRGFGLNIGSIDHLQVVTINKYNTIVISTLYKIRLFSSPQCLH